MAVINFRKKAAETANEHFTVHENGRLEYTAAGLDYYEPLFRRVRIPVSLIRTDQEHRAALSVVLETSLEPLRRKATANELSLEGQMLLAILDSDDNTEALDIQARIERRDSWKLV